MFIGMRSESNEKNISVHSKKNNSRPISASFHFKKETKDNIKAEGVNNCEIHDKYMAKTMKISSFKWGWIREADH